jgi:hypothetical protein
MDSISFLFLVLKVNMNVFERRFKGMLYISGTNCGGTFETLFSYSFTFKYNLFKIMLLYCW